MVIWLWHTLMKHAGPIRGVAVGAVFGAGDYQRAGRAEMVANGFFRPFVTPEWVDPRGAGCYSLILNNDNGLSVDGVRGYICSCFTPVWASQIRIARLESGAYQPILAAFFPVATTTACGLNAP
jgi:hypothetical protein